MNLRPTLLPALGVFAVAARHQNFALAGEELHLTASAVSHHVRKLESLLGAPLFQRHARGVTLTAEGRQLADAASAMPTTPMTNAACPRLMFGCLMWLPFAEMRLTRPRCKSSPNLGKDLVMAHGNKTKRRSA